MYVGDFSTSSIVYHHYTTRSTTGLPQTFSSVTLKVYKDDSTTTETTTGVTHNEDFDSITGLNNVKVDTSADATFYAAGHDFTVVVTAGTIDGSSMAGEVIFRFSIQNRFTTTGPTASAIATAVWQDSTSGDFTVASSIGKALYINNVAPGGTGGHFIAGTNADTTVNLTGNITGNLSGSIGSLGATAKTDVENSVWNAATASHSTAGSFGLLVATDLDATVSSRMATYVQPTGFLAATFPTTVASTTNITAGTITTVTNLTNAPTSGDLTSTMKTSVENAVWDGLTSAHSTSGSFGLLVKTDLDTNVGSRMASYIQPTGFLAATFPTTVASPTNITAGTITTVTNLTNAPTSGDLTAAMKLSVEDAVWDAPDSNHTATGTMGRLMNTAGSANDPWTANLPGTYATNEAGYIVGTFVDRPISQAKLGTDGLDAIPTTQPAGVASTFREMLVQTWRRFFKKTTKNIAGDGKVKTYADDNTTVLTSQNYIETTTSQEVDAAS